MGYETTLNLKCTHVKTLTRNYSLITIKKIKYMERNTSGNRICKRCHNDCHKLS